MAKILPYINRDISWLDFNYRVLQEAKDPSVPLFERIKFLAIYSNNLDEFFRVRVANHRNLVRVGKKAKRAIDYEPDEILSQMLRIVSEQQVEFSRIFKDEIVPELAEFGVHIIRRKGLTKVQKEYVENYFYDNIQTFIQPMLLVKDKIKPFLNNACLYLALILVDREEKKPEHQYAILNIPSDEVSRFLVLPPRNDYRTDVILLDDVVRHCARWIFPGYHIKDSFSIKLTRDAELYIDDEFTGDLITKIKNSLNKRDVGPASRLVYDRTMPKHLLNYLIHALDLTDFDLLPEGRYHNNFDFFKFPNFGLSHLQEQPLPPLPVPELEDADSIFDAIKEKDHLINVPFQSYESVIKFFEDASRDPNVTHIKIVQYRVARESRIMNALIHAVKAGKQVSAFIEVKARFDEESNLRWGAILEKCGVTVHYSMPGIKVHAKVAMVRRLEQGKSALYSYFSTGNFHEGTVKVYTDIGLFTNDERLVNESARLFSYLETRKQPKYPFKHLLVGQFNLRQKLIELINYEIENAKKGKRAEIILKMNSLQEIGMIQRLYDASKAGVKIKLIVRGICSLVPKVKEVSENIDAFSIVDRFLEHSRIFVFHHDGEDLMFFSSADWMARNLYRRVETIVPVYDPEHKHTLMTMLNIQLTDNVKSRSLSHKQMNVYRKDDSDIAIRSQLETYFYFKRKLEAQLAEQQEIENLKRDL